MPLTIMSCSSIGISSLNVLSMWYWVEIIRSGHWTDLSNLRQSCIIRNSTILFLMKWIICGCGTAGRTRRKGMPPDWIWNSSGSSCPVSTRGLRFLWWRHRRKSMVWNYLDLPTNDIVWGFIFKIMYLGSRSINSVYGLFLPTVCRWVRLGKADRQVISALRHISVSI